MIDGGDRIRPGGGALVEGGNQTVNFLIYPPTFSSEVQVEEAGQTVGTIIFPESPTVAKCPTSDTGQQARWVACATVLVVEWDTGLDVQAASVDGVDGVVRDPLTGALFGFYLYQTSDASTGLRLRFAFQRPHVAAITIELRAIYVDGETGDAGPLPSLTIPIESAVP